LDGFAGEARRALAGNVEALHRARVASRRLRELVPLLGLDGDIQKLGRGLKRVTRQLGTVRELDVLAIMIRELAQDARYPSTALQQLGPAIEEARVAARLRLAAELPLTKVEQLAHRLAHAVKPRELDDSAGRDRSTGRMATGRMTVWTWALDARVTHRATRVRAAIDAAGAVYVPERLHDVRIVLKKLRYAMELKAELGPGRAARDVAVLKSAQDLLGRLHDLEVLIGLARQAQASPLPVSLDEWRALGSLVRVLEDDCRALHARYTRDRTRLAAVADRIGNAKGHARPLRPRAVGAH
jgi:CHAD domain-containing protein